MIDGPALSIASLVSNREPFDSLVSIAAWAHRRGVRALGLPCEDPRVFDAAAAANDTAYVRDLLQVLAQQELSIAELSIEGISSMIAAHPAYDVALDRFAPPGRRGDRGSREQWAAEQLALTARAAFNLGVTRVVCCSGSLLVPYFAPGRTRPPGIAATAFAELARRWLPLLAMFDAADVDVCFAPSEGQDVCDGATFEQFLEATQQHPRVKLVYDPGRLYLRQIDYLEFVALYAARIGAFHLSDAELVASARFSPGNGFAPRAERPLRLRSLGEGEVDLPAVFDAMFRAGYDGWATLDWSCSVRDAESGVAMSVAYVQASLVRPPEPDPDSPEDPDEGGNRRALGLS